MKKLWFYETGNDKREATLTVLRSMIEKSKGTILLKLEKLDSNWFVEWEGSISIDDVDDNSIIGEYPYTSKIPKRLRLQIFKAKKQP